MIHLTRPISLISALALGLGIVTPSAAQLSGGHEGSVKYYDILSADGLNTVLGQVMTVPDMIMEDPDKLLPDIIMETPEGFEVGQVYWHWNNPKNAYPEAFILVTSPKAVPASDTVEDYDVFDHQAFDLSSPIPFPKMDETDVLEWTYSVYESDHKGMPIDTSADGWFLFEDGGLGARRAWARKDIDGPYLMPEPSLGLLFVSQALPIHGSVEVVEAK